MIGRCTITRTRTMTFCVDVPRGTLSVNVLRLTERHTVPRWERAARQGLPPLAPLLRPRSRKASPKGVVKGSRGLLLVLRPVLLLKGGGEGFAMTSRRESVIAERTVGIFMRNGPEGPVLLHPRNHRVIKRRYPVAFTLRGFARWGVNVPTPMLLPRQHGSRDIHSPSCKSP